MKNDWVRVKGFMAHLDDTPRQSSTIEEDTNELRGTVQAVSLVSMLAFAHTFGEKGVGDAIAFVEEMVEKIKKEMPRKSAKKAKEFQAMVRHLEVWVKVMGPSLPKK